MRSLCYVAYGFIQKVNHKLYFIGAISYTNNVKKLLSTVLVNCVSSIDASKSIQYFIKHSIVISLTVDQYPYKKKDKSMYVSVIHQKRMYENH